MKKKLVWVLSFGVLLASCSLPEGSTCACSSCPEGDATSIDPGTPGTSLDNSPESTPSTPVDQKPAIERALASISGTFAAEGSYDFVYSEPPMEEGGEGVEEVQGTGSLETVLGESSLFTHSVDESYGETSESQRLWERGTRGELIINEINPTTNTVNPLVAGYAGVAYAYDDMVVNPFVRAHYFFDLEDGKLVLKDLDSFNGAALWRLLFGIETNPNYLLSELVITLDEAGDPYEITASFGDVTPYYSMVYCYTGMFVDPGSIDAVESPKPIARQDGQDLLQARFDALKEMNYTLDWTISEKYNEDGEDAEPKVTQVTTYVTKEGYLHDYQEGFFYADYGAYTTNKGTIPFQFNAETGKYEDNQVPMQIRDSAARFGSFFQYKAAVFNVEENGSYVLPEVEGLASYVGNLFDAGAKAYGIPDAADTGSLKIVLNDDGGFTYTYSFWGEQIKITGIVKNVGTTVMPIDVTLNTPYDVCETWSEWFEAGKAWDSTIEAFNVLTNDNPDIIPFVDWAYSYEMSMDADQGPLIDEDGNFVFDERGMMVWVMNSVASMNWTFEMDTASEAIDTASRYISQLKATDGYTFDLASDSYIYEKDELKFSVHIGVQGAAHMGYAEADFNYGVLLNIVNLNA